MTEENAQLLQVIFGEIRNRRQIDAVLDETLGVFAKADALKKVFNPPHAAPAKRGYLGLTP
jgi:hypothetical protein